MKDKDGTISGVVNMKMNIYPVTVSQGRGKNKTIYSLDGFNNKTLIMENGIYIKR
jgi:hypothetical protein